MASIEKLPMLAEGYERITAELKALREERPRIVEAIEEARVGKCRISCGEGTPGSGRGFNR
jgi:hypothetical protein